MRFSLVLWIFSSPLEREDERGRRPRSGGGTGAERGKSLGRHVADSSHMSTMKPPAGTATPHPSTLLRCRPLPQGGRATNILHILVALCLILLSFPAFAVLPSERLADPALEARARALSQELRCLVCQNQSIDDSSADLAHDLRVLVRERLVAGDSDAQVLAYLTSRYGDYVLLRPPVEPATYLLWFGPPALLLFGGIVILVGWRRRAAASAGATLSQLSADERRRLTQMLDEGG
jgi:cytochrome c-type biogenesis protein CcmH